MKPTVIIVGGGWAGLSCAVELQESGHHVTLLEAAPQLGGRARSIQFSDRLVDNGQHVLIGAYRQTLQLLEKLGHREQELFTRLPLQLLLSDANGQTIRLGLPAFLPAPLSLAWGLLTMQGFKWSERMKALGFALRMKMAGFHLDQDQDVASLLNSYAQSTDLIDKLWEPLCLATLNTPLAEASGQLFLNVLRDSFSRHNQDTDILLPHSDIGRLLPELACNWLQRQGANITTGSRVSRLINQGDTITGVYCGDREYHADRIILAGSVHDSDRLLKPLPGYKEQFAGLQRLESYPVTTIYLQYEHDVALPYPMYGLVGTYAQWLIDRAHCQQADLLSVVISGPGPHMEMEKERLFEQVIKEISSVFPHLSSPQAHRVIREKRATFRAVTGINRYRPANKTDIPNLWLAGDYTSGPYPATLEAAVQSGVQCARQINEQSCSNKEL